MNCIVICCDSFRNDLLDRPDVDLPNLRSLSSRGTRFTNAFAEGLPTIQARRSMFTGRRTFPWDIPMGSRGLWPPLPGWHRIPDEQTTLAETLVEAGYTTGLVADTYHMFKPTQNFTRGFCSWNFIRGQEGDPLRSGPLSAIDISPYLPEGSIDPAANRSLIQYLLNMLDRKTEEDYLTAKVFQKASVWLEENRENLPFFLWIDSFAPHEFWDPPRRFADRYYRARASKDYIVPQRINDIDPDEDAIRRTEALYLGYATFVDEWIGRFLQTVDNLDIRDDTLLIFTSDHGTELWDRGRFGKHAMRPYRYNTQVPLVVVDPGTAPKTDDRLIQHIDFMPMILDRLAVKAPPDLDGNANGCATGKIITAWHETVAVRSDRWTVVLDSTDPNGRREVYDRIADPDETENVAQQVPAIFEEFAGFVERELGTVLPIPMAHIGDSRQVPPYIYSEARKRFRGNAR